MRPFEDGRIDKRLSVYVDEVPATTRDADEVRRTVDEFRGRVLSKAYALERQLDALIVWHLFRDRDDGMAAEFEDEVLHDGAFGLERKVRFARKIAKYWAEDDNKADRFGKAVTQAKAFRDRVAHWPVRLQPLIHAELGTIDYVPHIGKGSVSEALTTERQQAWLDLVEEARSEAERLARCIDEHCRLGFD